MIDKQMAKEHILLRASQLAFDVRDKQLLHDIEFSAPAGQFTAIIGPNGAGKTTLLNLLDGDNTPSQGKVIFDGVPIKDIDRLELAQKRAVLPQLSHIPFSIKVRDIVALGREPYRGSATAKYNDEIIEQSLSQLDMLNFADSHYTTLSGGEQHRVQMARTLAQITDTPDSCLEGKILFLDEPTNHLDIRHQYQLMEVIKQLQVRGLTIIAVMHDLALTLQYADRITLLKKGRLVGNYTSENLVNSGDLSKTYDMDMRVFLESETARYVVIPLPSEINSK